jgi:hypothetical protein
MKEEERRTYNIGMQLDSRTSNGLIVLGAMLMVAGLLVQIFSINITLYLVSPYGDPGVSSTFLSFIGVACASLSIAFREA